MRISGAIPVMAGLGLVGAAIGIHLGNSAVSMIDPVHYGGAEETRFHSDLVPQRQDWSAVQLAEYQEAQQGPSGTEGLGSGCVRCPDYPVSYLPEQHPAYAAWDSAPAAYAYEEEADYVVYEPEPEAEVDRRRVELYTSYPITEAEAEEQAALAEEEEALLAAAEALVDWAGTR